MNEPLVHLFRLLLLLFLCMLLGSSLAFFLLPSLQEGSLSALSLAQLRTYLILTQFFTFLLPALLYLWKFESLYQPFAIRSIKGTALSIAAYLISLPLFLFLYYLNAVVIPIPSWWPFEVQAIPQEILFMLSDQRPVGLFLNLSIIALLPALGEELIFRRSLLPILTRLLGSHHGSVWLGAALFSLFHFDFQGLLARFLLGLVLGYSFYLSRSVWAPIFIHFIHNGTQVLIAYIYPKELEQAGPPESSPSIVLATGSFLLLVAIFRYGFTQTNKQI